MTIYRDLPQTDDDATIEALWQAGYETGRADGRRAQAYPLSADWRRNVHADDNPDWTDGYRQGWVTGYAGD